MTTDKKLEFRHRLKCTVAFRLTEQEKETIDETAKNFNVTVSELCRASLLTTLITKKKEAL